MSRVNIHKRHVHYQKLKVYKVNFLPARSPDTTFRGFPGSITMKINVEEKSVTQTMHEMEQRLLKC